MGIKVGHARVHGRLSSYIDAEVKRSKDGLGSDCKGRVRAADFSS